MVSDIEITTGQAEKLLGVSTSKIKAMCRSGELKGGKDAISGRWMLSLASVNELLKQKRAGEPAAKE